MENVEPVILLFNPEQWHLDFVSRLSCLKILSYFSTPSAEELHAISADVLVVLGNAKNFFPEIRNPTNSYMYDWHGKRLLFSYSPFEIIKQRHLGKVLELDLLKAQNAKPFSVRKIHVLETPFEVTAHLPGILSAVDIETTTPIMTHIGWAMDANESYVVHLHNQYEMIMALKPWLESDTPKIFHNGFYDVGFLYYHYRIAVRGWEHDTMFLAHVKHSELKKSLKFLAGIYTMVPDWKFIGKSKDKDKE